MTVGGMYCCSLAGKVSCEACNKKCKGQAIKLPSADKYFHVKCFKCKGK